MGSRGVELRAGEACVFWVRWGLWQPSGEAMHCETSLRLGASSTMPDARRASQKLFLVGRIGRWVWTADRAMSVCLGDKMGPGAVIDIG
jgi:hypothetical protein